MEPVCKNHIDPMWAAHMGPICFAGWVMTDIVVIQMFERETRREKILEARHRELKLRRSKSSQGGKVRSHTRPHTSTPYSMCI